MKKVYFKCDHCKGSGSVTYNQTISDCHVCQGHGKLEMLEEEPTLTKEEAEKHNINPEASSDQETIRLFAEAIRLLKIPPPEFPTTESKKEKIRRKAAIRILVGIYSNPQLFQELNWIQMRELAIRETDALLNDLNK